MLFQAQALNERELITALPTFVVDLLSLIFEGKPNNHVELVHPVPSENKGDGNISGMKTLVSPLYSSFM